MLISYYLSFLVVIIVIMFVFWDAFKLDSQKLTSQLLFWIAIVFPIASFLLFSVPLVNENISLFKGNDYGDILTKFKFPLYFLAASPIMAALVTSAHNSLLTAKQIEEAERKNKVEIFLLKKKYLIEQLSNNTSFGEKINLNGLYKSAFTRKETFDYIVDYSFHENTDSLLEKLIFEIKLIFERSPNEFLSINNKEMRIKKFFFFRKKLSVNEIIHPSREIYHLDEVLNELFFHFNVGITDYIDDLISCLEINKDSNFNDIYYKIIMEVGIKLQDIMCDFYQLSDILLEDEVLDTIIPNFGTVFDELSKIPTPIKEYMVSEDNFILELFNGGKLAAENQNPPE